MGGNELKITRICIDATVMTQPVKRPLQKKNRIKTGDRKMRNTFNSILYNIQYCIDLAIYPLHLCTI